MKKLLFLLVCVCTMQFVWASDDKPIRFEQLPQTAQTFVKKHFPGLKVAFTKADKGWFDTSYDVVFVDGSKLEFDKNGAWKEVKCKGTFVPDAVVPAPVMKYIKVNYPDAKVLQLERDRNEFEVLLSNFWKIKFDTDFNVIDLDHDKD